MSLSLLKILNYVFTGTPVLFIAGMAIILFGAVKQQPSITRLGTGLFLSGAAVFMVALGGRDLAFRGLAARARPPQGKEKPMTSVPGTIFSLILVLLGIALQCIIIRGYFLQR